jgi:hypothetical protein
MRIRLIALPLLSLLVLACAPGSRPVAAEVPPARDTGAPSPAPLPREAHADDALCAPLLLDNDPGFGTNVVIRRVPNAKDLEDMTFITGLRQIVVALPEWPATYDQIRPMQQAILPQGVEIVVLLPGWPPTREALGAWNLVGGALRLIMIVDGPPTDRSLLTEVNRVRSLDRVIAQMENPSRSGFERLQRPLSFRVLRK